ncbi:MAG: 16S rRNA (cytosine(967)-C(5))-methyltransferase [Chlorobiaceae bacterium]|nr:16S rRNA (cytosine(967)-C(5))-methyltransferase [Chlorobiaceae bacterium]
MKSARELALRVLQAIDTGKSKSDSLLHKALGESKLERNERALATGIVYGVLRYRMRLDFIIGRFYHHDFSKAAPVLQNILRIGAFQLLYLDKVPGWAAVNESVKLARKYKGERMAKLTNGVLRKITPENVHIEEWLQEKELPERYALLHSHPQWLVERWLSAFGSEKCLSMLDYDNKPPLFGFRVNRLKTSPEEFFSNASVTGAELEACPLDHFFFSKDFSSFETAVREGLLSVQNPTQALACLLLNPSPGSTVLDLCAAPGGKSGMMAEMMMNTGSITSIDRFEQKLQKLATHAQALGISIIQTRAADARSYRPEVKPRFILLDAPCSGSGVLGRRAELRWKIDGKMLRELAELQRELLEHAATILDEGGALVYATCSVEPEENALQTASFLERHPEFEIDTDCSGIPEQFRNSAEKNGYLMTLPGDLPGFDGGFCQRLRKI